MQDRAEAIEIGHKPRERGREEERRGESGRFLDVAGASTIPAPLSPTARIYFACPREIPLRETPSRVPVCRRDQSRST